MSTVKMKNAKRKYSKTVSVSPYNRPIRQSCDNYRVINGTFDWRSSLWRSSVDCHPQSESAYVHRMMQSWTVAACEAGFPSAQERCGSVSCPCKMHWCSSRDRHSPLSHLSTNTFTDTCLTIQPSQNISQLLLGFYNQFSFHWHSCDNMWRRYHLNRHRKCYRGILTAGET